MNGLDLFSGIGGIGLALSDYVRTVVYCEQDRYAQGVLLSRMLSGEIDRAPIWDDVRTLRKEHLPKIDIIFGGFPCQDISVAGNGVGLAGERSGLFFEIIRLTNEICPAFVFLENVPAIRTRGLREVVRAFTDIRYDCRWTCVSAAEVGATHLRKRWFLLCKRRGLVAHANNSRKLSKQNSGEFSLDRTCYSGKEMADSERKRLERSAKCKARSIFTSERSWWSSEPAVGRVVNGLPNRVDRIKCLGNAVVPLQAKTAFERLSGIS